MDEQQVGYFTPLVANGLEQVVGSVAGIRKLAPIGGNELAMAAAVDK